MYKYKGLYSIAFIILAFINSTFALYKDQTGVIDWHQALVGTPKVAYFQKIIGRSNLIVGTESNVIANLNLRNDNINWRHALKSDETLITVAALENYVVSLSESKTSNIRIWHGSTGYLFFENIVDEVGNGNIENGDLVISGNNIYALIRGETIVKVNTITKSQEKKYKLNDNIYSKLFINKDSNEIIVVGKNKNEQLIVSIIDNQGRTISEKTVSDIKQFETSDVFFTGGKLVVKDLNNNVFTLNPTGSSVKNLNIEGVKQLTHVKDETFVITTKDNKNSLVKINNSVEKLASFENNDEGIISVFTNESDNYVSKTSIGEKESLVVEVMDVNTTKIAKTFVIKNNYDNSGSIVKVSLDSYRKRDGTILFRIFTITEDGSFHLYKEGNMVWNREESLANIADLKFISLPELTKNIPEAIFDKSSSLSKLISRIQYQISTIKDLFVKDNDSETEDLLKRDAYGFRQLLVFLTKKGKLICMETLTKQIIWTRFIGKDIEGFEGIKLTNIRSSAVQFPPIVAVIGSYIDNGKESTVVFSINATDGTNYSFADKEIKSVAKYPFKLLQTFRVSGEEKQDKIRIIALVKSETEVEFYPNSPNVLDVVKEMEKPIYFNLNDKIGGNTLKGYKLYINADKKPQIDFLYSKTFPDGEVIVSYGFKEPYDHVASLGKVLGNRNVLYKYLNPNILAVATIKPDEEYTSILSIYFIDTVKGSIIHHSFYEGGGETSIMTPKIIQYENIVICAFWNHGAPISAEELDKETKKLRKNIKKGAQIVAFELYESEIENQKDPNQDFSSFNFHQPYIVSKSYIFDKPITSIGVTTTRNSVANREIIVGLDNNELYGIHSIFLNARRKNSPPSNNDKQEGLIQYRPGIPITPKLIMTYSLSVTGIKTIISNPANLESTSLVAAYGLDVYLTRRSPSNNFDVLSDSFNKPFLVITMATIFIAVIYTSRKIKESNFKKAWKIKAEKKEDKEEKKDWM